MHLMLCALVGMLSRRPPSRVLHGEDDLYVLGQRSGTARVVS